MAAVTQEAQIEQFLREGAGATGRAAADLVERAVSAPGLFAFGELLDLDGVQRLAADPSLAGHLALLKLFAHGTLPEYRAAVAAGEPLPALTPAQELKLKKLTVATLAEGAATLAYDRLMPALELPTVRALEDLLINECMATGLVRGKLDQKARRFEVAGSFGRDPRPGQLAEVIAALEDWRDGARKAASDIRRVAEAARSDAEARATRRAEVEAEVEAAARKIKQAAIDGTQKQQTGGGIGGQQSAEDDEAAMDLDDEAARGKGIGSKRRR
jgi:COP9 signalosome complex subunit 7